MATEVKPWMRHAFSDADASERHAFCDNSGRKYVWLDEPPPEWSKRVVGRVRNARYYPDVPELPGVCVHFADGWVLHLSAPPPSGWHPAAAPGFVVGAMGCLIFGLYLRRWLIDRKALAGQPQRDMIA